METDPLWLGRLSRRFSEEDEARATAVRRASEARYSTAIRATEARSSDRTVVVLLVLLALSTCVNVVSMTAVAVVCEVSDGK